MNPLQKLFRLACMATAMVLVPLASLNAQDDQLPATTNPTQPAISAPDQDQDPPVSKKPFLEIVAQIRKNETAINRLFSTIPIGFPERQKIHMDKIEQLRADNLELQGLMEAAALEAYQANPGGDRRASRIVFNLLSNKIDVTSRDGFFDPKGALEIADMMLKAGSQAGGNPGQIPLTDVAYQAFRASFAIEDFERADMMLKKIESAANQLRPFVREQLEKTRESWNRELMIRRLESSADDLPQVKFETTAGDIVVELFENHAPQAVGNFISLVEKHFYDDLSFFHVQPGEFAQTGCPLDNGQGGPGYQIPCECDREQIRHHFSGTLSMVNNGRDTGGSQFRIMHQPSLHANGKNTAFGRVIEGMDVVYRLTKVDQTKNTTSALEPQKITKATVIRKRDHDYPFSQLAKKPNNPTGISDPPSPLDPAKSSTPGG